MIRIPYGTPARWIYARYVCSKVSRFRGTPSRREQRLRRPRRRAYLSALPIPLLPAPGLDCRSCSSSRLSYIYEGEMAGAKGRHARGSYGPNKCSRSGAEVLSERDAGCRGGRNARRAGGGGRDSSDAGDSSERRGAFSLGREEKRAAAESLANREAGDARGCTVPRNPVRRRARDPL